jgi:transcriptional regulator GlxA family with amidase domain
VEWVKEARWVEDGKFFTSSGVSAGIDMSLAAISRIAGEQISNALAMAAEYDWHRDANWDPFAKLNGLV